MRLDQSERDLPGLLEMVRQIRLVSPNSSEGLGSAVGAQPDATPTADPAEIRSRQFPGKPVAQPAPTPQAQSQAPGDDSDGFDVQRALGGLVHGIEGIRAVDASRAQKAQTKLAQERQGQDMELGRLTLEGKRKEAVTAQEMADPNSLASQRARHDAATMLAAMAETDPASKKIADGLIANLEGASAIQVASMQDRFSKIFDYAAKVGHNRATEEMARARLDQGERQIAATYAEREDRRAERDEARDEKAIDTYGKETEPLDVNAKLLGSVAASDVKTGWIPDKLAKVRQFLGFKDDAWDTAEGTLASVRNELRHGLFGGALTPQEGAEYAKELPDMTMPRATFDAKLNAVLNKIAMKKDAAAKRHPRAVRAIAKQSGADQSNSKRELAKQALNDPEATPEEKAAAKRILGMP